MKIVFMSSLCNREKRYIRTVRSFGPRSINRDETNSQSRQRRLLRDIQMTVRNNLVNWQSSALYDDQRPPLSLSDVLRKYGTIHGGTVRIIQARMKILFFCLGVEA